MFTFHFERLPLTLLLLSADADHSKWAFSSKSRHVFVGDLNRNVGQYDRGGGGIIIRSDHLYAFMSGRAKSWFDHERLRQTWIASHHADAVRKHRATMPISYLHEA